MTQTIDLQQFCADESRHEWLKSSQLVRCDGRKWWFASDSRLGVATVASWQEVALSEAKSKICKLLQGCRLELGNTTAEALASWCGPHEGSKEVVCYNCGGDGECNACHCDNPHTCGDCDGSGKRIDCPDPREGVIHNLVVDRNLLAKTNGLFSGPCVVMAGQSAPIKDKEASTAIVEFRAADWRILIASMEKKKIETDWPRLELTEGGK